MMSDTDQTMAKFSMVCSALFYGVQLDGPAKKFETPPAEYSSDLQIQEDSSWVYDLPRNEGEETKVFQDTERRESREMSSRRRDLSRKAARRKRKQFFRGIHSRSRGLRKGIRRENIDQGAKVYKDACDLSWDDKIEENTTVFRNVHNIEVDIAEYAAWSLPDFLWTQLENNYSETMKLSGMLRKYWGDNDRMLKNTPLSCPHAVTSRGVMSYTIEGLNELVHFRAEGHPFECEILNYLNSETFSFCVTTKRAIDTEAVERSMCPMVNERLKKPGSSVSTKAAKNTWSNDPSCSTVAALPSTPQIDIRASHIYIFVVALKYFISKYFYSRNGLTPYTFCRLNQFLASSDAKRDTEWYVGLSDRCQCKLGVHSWLEEFIHDISFQDLRADRLKDPTHYSNYAENIQEDKTKTLLYVISRLYLKFIAKECFGEQTRPMGMIILQAFAIKWMHYTTLPFDEDDWEFQEVIYNLSRMPVEDLTDYLEEVLCKRVKRLISDFTDGSSPVKDSNSGSYIPDTNPPVTLREVDTCPELIIPLYSIESDDNSTESEQSRSSSPQKNDILPEKAVTFAPVRRNDDDDLSPLIAQETSLNEKIHPITVSPIGKVKESSQEPSFSFDQKGEVGAPW
ncbi:hypothetical protein BOTCAL_0659g00020 [Botryotinia calthae]|uniref:Uncharacterized protein n=1 Tax=Botryotinia calthae TaxID=38488 RepID=A0A4Y8CHT2_9HELO|nr:hypothetical protein BOTCAL_0659g00020 [Botryotinia calthae]